MGKTKDKEWQTDNYSMREETTHSHNYACLFVEDPAWHSTLIRRAISLAVNNVRTINFMWLFFFLSFFCRFCCCFRKIVWRPFFTCTFRLVSACDCMVRSSLSLSLSAHLSDKSNNKRFPHGDADYQLEIICLIKNGCIAYAFHSLHSMGSTKCVDKTYFNNEIACRFPAIYSEY